MEAIAIAHEEYDEGWCAFIDGTDISDRVQPFMPAARRMVRAMYPDKGKEAGEEIHGLVTIGATTHEVSKAQIRNIVMDKSKTDGEVTDELIPEGAAEAEFWSIPVLRLKFSAARTALTRLTLGPSITNLNIEFPIGTTKFPLLTQLKLPASFSAIPNSAFSNNNKIQEVEGDGVRSLGNDSFWRCGALSKFSSNAALTSMGSSAFSEATSLVEFNADIRSLQSITEYVFYRTKSLMQGPTKDKGGSEDRKLWHFREASGTLGGQAMLEFGGINSKFRVVMPNIIATTYYEGWGAFETTKGIEELYLNSCQTIADCTFRDIANLKKLVIGGETVTVAGDYWAPNTPESIELIISDTEKADSGATTGTPGIWKGKQWKSVSTKTRAELDSMTFA